LKTLHFYIVEDEPLITLTIATILKKQGHIILGDSESHDIALKEILISNPDIVLLDIRLEGKKNGVDLALQLDKLDIKYIYLSSLADPITNTQIKKTFPLGFIHKPFTAFGLQTKITNYCQVAY